MKEKYEKVQLTITRFSNKDVITTSDINNWNTDLSKLSNTSDRNPMNPTR